MGYFHTDRTTRNQLRLVFGDRVVSCRLSPDATLGDVAMALCELGPRRYGHPVAIDVTMADSPEQSPLSHVIPAWVTYEDDPAAEFEDATLPDAWFRGADHTVGIHA